jgi:hypothetical protein
MEELNTASAVISFAKRLEEGGVKFYEDIGQRHAQHRESSLTLAKENRKNIVQVERAYYGVITDALEGCFSFKISAEKYAFERQSGENLTYSDTLGHAIHMEEIIASFYSDAARQSESFLADVSRVFQIIARNRAARISRLKELLARDS